MPGIAIPSYLDREVWDAFTEMRRAKGKSKPYTTYAAKLVLYELHSLRGRGYDPNECLRQSIKYGWSDVFPPKEKSREFAHQGEDVRRTQDYLSSKPKWKPEDSQMALEAINQIKAKLRRVA